MGKKFIYFGAFGKNIDIKKSRNAAAAVHLRNSGNLRQNIATQFAPNGL